MKTIQQLQPNLDQYKAPKKWYRHWCSRSAVAIILREGEQGLEALMIKRAEREGDPWSGHMAFPGGRMDNDDTGGLSTAQRETWEEIGLAANKYSECIGRLPDLKASRKFSLKPFLVSCFVFSVEVDPELTLNYEVADVIWVPLAFLADSNNRESMEWKRDNRTMTLSCYFYQGERIWGLSLRMLDELLAIAMN